MHQRRYQRGELRDKVERAGFRIERITSFISLLLPLMIWSRMQRKRHQEFEPWREFEISPALNKTLESILKLERAITRSGRFFSRRWLATFDRQKTGVVIRIPFNRPFATGDELGYIRTARPSPKFSGDGAFTQRLSSDS